MTLLEAEAPAAEPPPAPASPGPPDARRLGERLGALLGEIGAVAEPRVAERSEELVSLLMQFYGTAVERMLEIADDAGVLHGALLDRLTDDELVSSVLILHDLHPLDTLTRIQGAIDRVRPYLGSHGGGVEIIGIEGDAVRLRMEGSCSSCPSSKVTLDYAIEKAVLEAAPEIARIVAEGLEAPPPGGLIQLEPLGTKGGNGHGPAGHAHGTNGHGSADAARVPGPIEWREVDALAALGGATLGGLELAGTALVLCRAGADLYAYRDQCANCRAPLAEGRLADAILTCATCGFRFDVRLAGRSVGDGARHLDPLPLLPDGAIVRIAIPVAPA